MHSRSNFACNDTGRLEEKKKKQKQENVNNNNERNQEELTELMGVKTSSVSGTMIQITITSDTRRKNIEVASVMCSGIASSTPSMSALNRLMILPTGVLSKKYIGVDITDKTK
jgi:hypothetical protein